MSYVGAPFDYDLFISYARANLPGTMRSPLREWSLALAEELRVYLLRSASFRAHPQRTLKVFLDESADGISGLDPLTPRIRDAAASSAMLLVLMSEDFLASGWCKQELEAWSSGQKAYRIASDKRIAIVRAEPTSEQLWPSQLRDHDRVGLAGYWFHSPSLNQTPIDTPFGSLDPKRAITLSEFQTPFLRLGTDIRKRLIELRAEIDARAEAAEHETRLMDMAPWLYLHGRSGQDNDWTNFHAQLSRDGFKVMPIEIDPILKSPAEEEKLYNERLRTMKECDAVLMMSTENFSAFDADLIHIVRRVRQSLQAHGRPLLPCALLNTVAKTELTEKRQALADDLKLKWIDSTRDRWLAEVRAWLEELRAKVRNPT
jgi:hypothetical protein